MKKWKVTFQVVLANGLIDGTFQILAADRYDAVAEVGRILSLKFATIPGAITLAIGNAEEVLS